MCMLHVNPCILLSILRYMHAQMVLHASNCYPMSGSEVVAIATSRYRVRCMHIQYGYPISGSELVAMATCSVSLLRWSKIR